MRFLGVEYVAGDVANVELDEDSTITVETPSEDGRKTHTFSVAGLRSVSLGSPLRVGDTRLTR